MPMLPTPVTQTTTSLPAVMARATEAVTIVTGGAGFLGSHLCSRLVDQGARVIAIDNLSTGRRAAGRADRR